MPYLAAAVVLVGTLGFLDLLLSLAIIRRLRQQGQHPAGAHGNHEAPGAQPPVLPTGMMAPEFTATTTDGTVRTLGSLAGQHAVIGFFAAACDSCRTQLDDFAACARSLPGGPGQALAIVSGDPAEGADIVRKLDGPASVVVEPDDSPTANAFSVWGFPTFFALDGDGRIVSAGMQASRLQQAELV